MIYQIFALIILVGFYSVYIGKMIVQKRKGIQTDQIAKGKKDNQLFAIEVTMKIATYSIVIIEIVSIAMITMIDNAIVRIIGICLGLMGLSIFILSVYTMKDSWRAGIPEKDKTEMITDGIYSISRNPAFLGFDLVYIGILLAFFNWVLLVFTIFAIIMLHLQILQEEKYLPDVFGNEYNIYRKKVRRYIGRL